MTEESGDVVCAVIPSSAYRDRVETGCCLL